MILFAQTEKKTTSPVGFCISMQFYILVFVGVLKEIYLYFIIIGEQ
jgi:hypothetical protein